MLTSLKLIQLIILTVIISISINFMSNYNNYQTLLSASELLVLSYYLVIVLDLGYNY